MLRVMNLKHIKQIMKNIMNTYQPGVLTAHYRAALFLVIMMQKIFIYILMPAQKYMKQKKMT